MSQYKQDAGREDVPQAILPTPRLKGGGMKVTCDYDDDADVLYLTFDGAEEAICYEKEIPVLVRYNPLTDRISGITILNLKEINQIKKRTEDKEIHLLKKDRNNLRNYLKNLSSAIKTCLRTLDEEMKKPSDRERGKRIAHICNQLEMVNDQARYFGLGIDYRKDRKK